MFRRIKAIVKSVGLPELEAKADLAIDSHTALFVNAICLARLRLIYRH